MQLSTAVAWLSGGQAQQNLTSVSVCKCLVKLMAPSKIAVRAVDPVKLARRHVLLIA